MPQHEMSMMYSETDQNDRISRLPLRLQDIANQGIASRATLWRWKEKGLKTHKVGGVVFIFPDDLAAFIRSHSSPDM